jgi:hypothetical protein
VFDGIPSALLARHARGDVTSPLRIHPTVSCRPAPRGANRRSMRGKPGTSRRDAVAAAEEGVLGGVEESRSASASWSRSVRLPRRPAGREGSSASAEADQRRGTGSTRRDRQSLDALRTTPAIPRDEAEARRYTRDRETSGCAVNGGRRADGGPSTGLAERRRRRPRPPR